MHSRKSYSTVPKVSSTMKPNLSRALTLQRAALWFLAAVFVSGCVVHGGHGRGHGQYKGPVTVRPHVDVCVPAPVTFVFTDHHRHSVRSYYRDDHHPHGKKHKWKGKGKGKGRGHRPPGLHKHDVYPSGVHMQALPPGLARQLPPAPHGTQFVYYSDQVLLVDLHTHVILDFIDISVGF